MITQFVIRKPGSNSYFIAFDHEWQAVEYWNGNIARVATSDYRYGAQVVRHSWETKAEAETARLDFLLGNGGIEAFLRALPNPPSEAASHSDRLKAARAIIDACRGVPAEVYEVVWPKPAGA